jgi:serine/threonine protein kinase
MAEEQQQELQAEMVASSPRCGTVQYMSPEMLMNTPSASGTSSFSSAEKTMTSGGGGGVIDMRATDVWSLGVVLYVLLSGSHFPFGLAESPDAGEEERTGHTTVGSAAAAVDAATTDVDGGGDLGSMQRVMRVRAEEKRSPFLFPSANQVSYDERSI